LHGNWNPENKPQTKEAGFKNPSQVIKEAVTFMTDLGVQEMFRN
jgi:hypothetical protein